jgi:3-carboxy-cis,cis-muconate cycloisomerase
MTAPGSLHADLFGERDVAAHLSDRARLQALLAVEVALAEAEAQVGIVPSSAVPAIARAAGADYDLAALAQEAARAGNVVVPLVRHLTRQVASIDPEAARYVHWGATSQDILDTGLVLQLRGAFPPLLGWFERAAAAAARHARRHRTTPMAGRTWLRQATPTTFGLKAAGWLDALERVRRRMDDACSGALVVQFGGASGTLAALGPSALAVSAALSERLGLQAPPAPWHAHRDRIAHLACTLGVAAGTLGKIAKDLALLGQTEVNEVSAAHDEGTSSTMPHKRNPVAAAVALAAAVRVPGLVATLLAAMPQEHERGLGGWHAEWDVMPEIVLLVAGAARSVAEALDDLVVDVDRMQRNLAITGGLTQAEAVTMELARHMGKAEAHALVEAACRRAESKGRPLADALAEDAAVMRVMSRDSLARRLSPDAHLGAAGELVDRVLAHWNRLEKADA